MARQSLSFVVPAYNEERYIGRTLDSLAAAARTLGIDWETVVADDASDDSTARIARECCAKVVHVNRRHIAAARNAGAHAASGDLFVFVDADTVVPAETLAQAVAVIEEGGVAGGSGCAFDGTLPRWARVVAPPILALYRVARLTPGAFLFCTRGAFHAVGGFDESYFGGEEVVMARALDRYARERGSRFTIVRSAVVTSGRKLRTYSGMELFTHLARLVLGGRRGAARRENFGLWYDPRRPDPEGVPDAGEPGADRPHG